VPNEWSDTDRSTVTDGQQTYTYVFRRCVRHTGNTAPWMARCARTQSTAAAALNREEHPFFFSLSAAATGGRGGTVGPGSGDPRAVPGVGAVVWTASEAQKSSWAGCRLGQAFPFVLSVPMVVWAAEFGQPLKAAFTSSSVLPWKQRLLWRKRNFQFVFTRFG